jgi:hypothetical protein
MSNKLAAPSIPSNGIMKKRTKESNAQALVMVPPEKIEFRPPFTSVSSSSLLLKNPTARVVAFKIKTTAPKRYCVRPNAGTIEQNESTEIKVMLQPGSTDERHKFMVQTVYVPNNYKELSKEDQAACWSGAEPVMSSKLVCDFLLSASEDTPNPAEPVFPNLSNDMREENTDDTIRTIEEEVHQHSQKLKNDDAPPPAYATIQTDSSKPESLSIQAAKKISQGSISSDLADIQKTISQNVQKGQNLDLNEEIRRLQSELQDKAKQIEILSSAPPPARQGGEITPEQQKIFLFLLFIAFIAGFLIKTII